MPAQLLSLSDGPSILLDKPIVLIGRHEECDLQLNSRKVSRKHCCIAQVKDHLVIRDLGSTNGVRINSVRVSEGILRTGDELTIGNFRYTVHCDVPREVAVAPPAPAAARPAILVDEDGMESVDVPVKLPECDDPPSPLPPSDASAPLPDAFRLATDPARVTPPPQ